MHLIKAQQQCLQRARELPVPAHKWGADAVAARVEAGEQRVAAAELQAAVSSLELAAIRGDMNDTEFKRQDLEQEGGALQPKTRSRSRSRSRSQTRALTLT